MQATSLSFISHRVKGALNDNASAILTATGVVGTVTTAVLASRASFKAARIIDGVQENRMADRHDDDVETPEKVRLDTLDKVKLVWPQFIPPAITGTGTVVAVVMANHINAQRAAALAAAYGIAERNLSEYKDKIEEKLTGPKAQSIKDEIQQDRINNNPPNQQTIIVGTGPVLCYDGFSDRYFHASTEAIKKAERVVRDMVETSNEASLRDFYDEIGLPHTHYDTMLGWSINHPPKITISAMLVNETDACLCVEFDNFPMPNFGLDY